MPTENIKENAVRKVIQELVVPDLQKLIGKIDILEERISSVKNELKSDIARIDERINSLDGKIDSLDEKIEINYKRLDEKIGSLDSKMDTKITALSDFLRLPFITQVIFSYIIYIARFFFTLYWSNPYIVGVN